MTDKPRFRTFCYTHVEFLDGDETAADYNTFARECSLEDAAHVLEANRCVELIDEDSFGSAWEHEDDGSRWRTVVVVHGIDRTLVPPRNMARLARLAGSTS